jgi:hypothetical protein
LVDNVNRQKAVGTLAALHRAIVSSRSRRSIPNIEFVFTVEDLPAEPEKPLWALARRAQDEDLWLIPDFGFWAWDMPQIGTLAEVAAEATERETIEPWDSKIEKLVWRGKVTMAPKLRRALIDAAKGKPWSDVGQVKWSNPDFREQFLGPVDQCNYMFIAHAEGMDTFLFVHYRIPADPLPRAKLLGFFEIPTTLPLRHRLPQTPVDTTLPLPLQGLGREPKLRRSRARLLRPVSRHERPARPPRESQTHSR